MALGEAALAYNKSTCIVLCLQDAWRRHEYATISASTLSMALGEEALQPEQRSELWARNRKLIREGYANTRAWVDASNGLVSMAAPDATALAFVR